ncbi:glycosyltransferase family protein [Candidatus Pelagibacter bacterium nBUS_32]|uniref:glycosyltransferase family protein n=1 Tax=Candidatus Pelagibacter bacterium nBUS_32 TaxID=3374192 RepID=UPI003EBF1D8E
MKKKEIVILSSFFNSNFINQFYELDKSLKNLDYNEQVSFIKKKNFLSRVDFGFFFSKEYETIELFTGTIFPIKKLFIQENINELNQNIGVLKLIEKWDPKIIIFRDINSFSIRKINSLKNIRKLKFKTVLLNGFPIRDKKDYSLFDFVVFRNPWLINKYSNLCKNTELIYHCFNTNILNEIKIKEFDKREVNISFDGSSYSDGFYEHKKRYFFLYNLLKKKLIKANIYEKENFFQKLSYYIFLLTKNISGSEKKIIFILRFISNINKSFFKRFYKRLDLIIENIENFNSTDFKLFFRGPLKLNFKDTIGKPNFGLDYYRNINNSKISLNIHTESMGDTAANIRLFEIAGMKSCMITENFQNLTDLFLKDKEVITYDSYDELIEKIYYLKNNLKFAKKIAENGHKKLLQAHTDKIRINEYFELLKKI